MGVGLETIFDIADDTEKEISSPNMREKIKEYISELCEEVDKCEKWIFDNMNANVCKMATMEARIQTLLQVKCDLESRLNEVV